MEKTAVIAVMGLGVVGRSRCGAWHGCFYIFVLLAKDKVFERR